MGESLHLDLSRSLRRGIPEVVFGLGKSEESSYRACLGLYEKDQAFFATHLSRQVAQRVQDALGVPVQHCSISGSAWCSSWPFLAKSSRKIALLSGGTSDEPVLLEAFNFLRWLGAQEVVDFQDIGVAGLERLLTRLSEIRQADILIVVAGMEAALASVVAGLVSSPVIAVPTSVGYGVSEGGQTAMKALLTSCVPGIAVVNIDNGFGAAYLAAQMAKIGVGDDT